MNKANHNGQSQQLKTATRGMWPERISAKTQQPQRLFTPQGSQAHKQSIEQAAIGQWPSIVSELCSRKKLAPKFGYEQCVFCDCGLQARAKTHSEETSIRLCNACVQEANRDGVGMLMRSTEQPIDKVLIEVANFLGSIPLDSPPASSPEHDVSDVYHRLLEFFPPSNRGETTFLLNRGFSPSLIGECGYGYLPKEAMRREAVFSLEREFGRERLLRTPGFLLDGDDHLSLAGASGLLVPTRSEDKRIHNVYVRQLPPNPWHEYWGLMPRSPEAKLTPSSFHVATHEEGLVDSYTQFADIEVRHCYRQIRIVFDPMVADLAAAKTDTITVSVPPDAGVEHVRNLLEELGVEELLVAPAANFHADIRKACLALDVVRIGMEMGVETFMETWPQNLHDLDEALVNGDYIDRVTPNSARKLILAYHSELYRIGDGRYAHEQFAPKPVR